MVWSSKSKDLGLAKVVPHPNTDPNVAGRAPAISSMTFSPMELFGAAARCSHLQVVNPAMVTTESAMIGALLEQHVDNSSSDFAIMSSADNFKDYVKSYFAGTVAAGVSYLAMIRDGYVWSDHFENLGGGSSSTRKTPDFVFAGVGTGVALMESKGSRSARSSAFDTTVDDGYADQVEPHLGHAVGGVTATHGFCIGAYLRSTTKAELRVHHTATPVAGVIGGTGDPRSTSSVQRHNYATAFRLAHSERLSQQLRSGDVVPDPAIPFFRIHWRGRNWLSSPSFNFGYYPANWRPPTYRGVGPIWFAGGSGSSIAFAVDEAVGLAVLNQFLGGGAPEGVPTELRPLALEGELTSPDELGGAVFPDGLAVLSGRTNVQEFEQVVWDRTTGQILPVR